MGRKSESVSTEDLSEYELSLKERQKAAMGGLFWAYILFVFGIYTLNLVDLFQFTTVMLLGILLLVAGFTLLPALINRKIEPNTGSNTIKPSSPLYYKYTKTALFYAYLIFLFSTVAFYLTDHFTTQNVLLPGLVLFLASLSASNVLASRTKR
ncbi:hypothetical protein [Fictibacillus fluitans]|uniref:Uncharacterized protein n=1 Tax=Fictibacillus fluitans TaxID=3058422 RepID=A0ABT8HX52_9BACL|nr:hypothetical protein [Fictibacillus sp. NE201]MDN4525065.1 hypothetical protein [Fictibacillus sp. NE201]